MREWQGRLVEEIYAVIFMDAIPYHVRSEGRMKKRALYIVIGMYVGEDEIKFIERNKATKPNSLYALSGF